MRQATSGRFAQGVGSARLTCACKTMSSIMVHRGHWGVDGDVYGMIMRIT